MNCAMSRGHPVRRFVLSNLLRPAKILPHQAGAGDGPVHDEDSACRSLALLQDQGVIRPVANAPGMFHYLPLAMRSLDKLTRLIDVHLQSIDCQRIQMPLLTRSDLLSKTGRLKDMGDILLKVRDRQDRDFVLSPTHEEAATLLAAGLAPISHRELPLRLYQVGSKFRDEMRPRFGPVRGKEFLMKDLYTFDADVASAEETYAQVTEVYEDFFRELGVPFVRVRGENSSMGGSLSHEFHFDGSAVGEDRLVLCPRCARAENAEVGGWTFRDCPECSGSSVLSERRGVEVGHTFLLGDHYSSRLGAEFVNLNGKPEHLQMGCYGLGVSRIMAAAVEALSTPNEIRWPKAIVPFTVCIVAPKGGSKEAAAVAEMPAEMYDKLDSTLNLHRDVVLDDRERLTVGKKQREARKSGYRFVVLFGRDVLDGGGCKVEVQEVGTDGEWAVQKMTPEQAVDYLTQKASA